MIGTKLKVKLENKDSGYAFGKNLEGKFVIVINGDLINGSVIEGIVIEDNENCLLAEIPQTYQNEEMLKQEFDEEELISTRSVIEIMSPTIFEIKEKWVFPHYRIQKLVKYLITFKKLWVNSKISFTDKRKVYTTARTFGLSFQKAVEKFTKSGFSKARLYCDKRREYQGDGVVAEMLAQTYITKDEFIGLEIWQGVENVNEIFYAHGITNKNIEIFTHFDCAILEYDIGNKKALFEKNKKIKGSKYKKLFRIDGNIDSSDIFELANRFFPLDDLIDEYFEIERIK